MKIGEVAALADVGIDTIRFYERRGILPRAARRASGYRDYGEATIERLRFVRALKEMGFALEEIAGLLEQIDRGAATCASERRRFEAVLTKVDRKMTELRRVRGLLRATIRKCASGACTLLDTSAKRRKSARFAP